MESPEIKDNLLEGQFIAIYINRSTSCIACNKIQPVNNEGEFVTCKNCKMTTLASIFQTKLVSQMMFKTDQKKFEIFTSFNDAIQSFLTLKCPMPVSELKEDEMKKLLVKWPNDWSNDQMTSQMRRIASKNTKIISQFPEIVA